MEFLLGILVVIGVINTLLLVAVAASLAKLIRYVGMEDAISVPKKQSKELVDLPAVGMPTYDLAVLQGKVEPFTDGMERRLTTRNWDGISQ